MKKRTLQAMVVGGVVVLLRLAGCGSPEKAPTATRVPTENVQLVASPTRPMVTPVPSNTAIPTATEEATETIQPTVTPKASPTEVAQSAVGVKLAGPIQIEQNADSGTIELILSEDGNSISKVTVELTGVKIEERDGNSIRSLKMEHWSIQKQGPIPISGGTFTASLGGQGEISGQLTSAGSADGTVHMSVDAGSLSTLGGESSQIYDLGTWNWTAST